MGGFRHLPRGVASRGSVAAGGPLPVWVDFLFCVGNQPRAVLQGKMYTGGKKKQNRDLE